MAKCTLTLTDRVVSALTYITAGWGGLIYAVLMYLRKRKISKFTTFNIYQSIFVSLLFFAVSVILGFVLKILSYIPLIDYLVVRLTFFFNRPFLADYSLIQIFIFAVVIYMTLYAAIGRIPVLYWVSDIIKRQLNGK